MVSLNITLGLLTSTRAFVRLALESSNHHNMDPCGDFAQVKNHDNISCMQFLPSSPHFCGVGSCISEASTGTILILHVFLTEPQNEFI